MAKQCIQAGTVDSSHKTVCVNCEVILEQLWQQTTIPARSEMFYFNINEHV